MGELEFEVKVAADPFKAEVYRRLAAEAARERRSSKDEEIKSYWGKVEEEWLTLALNAEADPKNYGSVGPS